MIQEMSYISIFQYIRIWTHPRNEKIHVYGAYWDKRNGLFESLTPEKRLKYIKSKIKFK